MDNEAFLQSFATPLGRSGEPEKTKASFRFTGSLLDRAGKPSPLGDETIKVFVRIRPCTAEEATREGGRAGVEAHCDGEVARVRVCASAADGSISSKSFTFNDVLGTSASQEDVYSAIQPCVESVLAGFNSTVFAYGCVFPCALVT